jgi:hypothetical protein
LPKLPELLNRLLSAPPELGRRWRTSAVEVRPVRSMSARSTKVTGWSWESGSRRIREPVMTMASPAWVSWAAAVGALGLGWSGWPTGGWAQAEEPAASARVAAPERIARENAVMSCPLFPSATPRYRD